MLWNFKKPISRNSVVLIRRLMVILRNTFLNSMILVLSFGLSAQTLEKKIHKQSFSLFSLSSTFQVSPKWSIISDVQERSFMKPIKQNQLSLRIQVQHNLGNDWTAAGGTSYVLTRAGDPTSLSTLIIPEIRINQDLNYKQRFSGFGFSHRYRMEERFIRRTMNDTLIEGHRFIERLSYTLSFEFNLLKSKNNFRSLAFKASNGIFINAGKHIVYNTFDQNRLYTGLNYQLYKNIAIELGYINIFQQRNSGNEFYNRNIVSFSINHKMRNQYQAVKHEL